jgi:hypothetical protein
MNPASPPLPRLLSALGVSFLRPKLPLDHTSWREGNSPEFARQFFNVYNQNMDALTVAARLPILALSVVFALAVFGGAAVLFGFGAGVIALLLYVFCPDIVAHSSLATSDLTVAFFFFLTLAAFWAYLKNPSAAKIVLTGIFAGCAFLSKFSAIALFPSLFFVALFAGAIRQIRPARTALFLIVTFVTIWAGYFFEIKPLLKNTPDPAKKAAMVEKIGGPRLLALAEKIPVPLSTFSSAFVSMMVTRARGTNAYLMGEWSRQGWWYYYFVAFVIKNTLPFLIGIAFALFFARRLGLDRITSATIFVPVIFFFTATLGDKAQAGIRYFLPIYPLLFILVAGAGVRLWKKGLVARLAVVVLLIWHAASAILVYPNYLAYFNEMIGGPANGYRYLRDSNVDWGQDLKGVGKWVREEKYPEVVIETLSPGDPKYYGIPARAFFPDEYLRPRNTVYAIGAHSLDQARWTKFYKPTKIIGYSFFIYDLRKPESASI